MADQAFPRGLEIREITILPISRCGIPAGLDGIRNAVVLDEPGAA